MPPNGIPPLSLIGLAFMEVIVSKHAVKVTNGDGLRDTGYWMLDAGLFVAHNSEDVTEQVTRSPLKGKYE